MDSKGVVQVLIDRIKAITNKPIEYGYLEDYNLDNFQLLNERFIINIESTKSETIGINHRKQKERVVNLIYATFNNVKNNSQDIIEQLESYLDILANDEVIKRHIINMDYEYTVEIEKASETDITGVVLISTKLTIKER